MQAIRGRTKRGLLCTCLAVAASAVLGVGSAGATTVTETNVTSAAPAFGFGNDDILSTDPSNVRAVTGTSDGTAGTDQVDIRCEAPGTDILLTSGVTVGTGGAFSTTVNDTTGTGGGPGDFEGSLCRIIAVPAGTDPSDLSTYTGPVVGNGRQLTTISSGVESDYFISQPQTAAYNDYDSLGSCGLCDSLLYASDLTPGTNYLWFDNGAIYSGSYTSGATSYPYAQIDSTDVYNPDSATAGLTGAPALTFTHTVDPATGDMEITETDPFVKCVASGPNSCASYASAGLELDRTILQSQSGEVVRIADVIRSTDNASHTYSFAYDEYEQSNNDNNEFQFPGDTGYKAYASGASGALSTSPVQTIYAISDGTQAPSVNNPAGAITVSPAPSAARFGCSSTVVTNCDGFDLVYTGTVPAGGSTAISQYFGIGATQSTVQGYATSNVQALTPTVAITNPAADGTTVHTASITVSGTVSANVTSLTVDGKAVTPSSGAWSTMLTLNRGANTITAAAKDGEGVSATGTRTVTYTPIQTAVKLGTIKVKGTKLMASLTCTAASGSKCAGVVELTVRERVKVKKHKTKLETVTVGKANYSFGAGTHTVTVSLNGTGRKLLAKKATLSATVNLLLGRKNVAHKTATFKAAKKKHKKS
jgi:hypothetical protein